MQTIFNSKERLLELKNKMSFLYRPFLTGITNSTTSSLSITLVNFFNKPESVNSINFNYYANDINYETLEDNYENIKNFKYLYFLTYQNLNFNTSNFFTPFSYTTVLDSFRANYDENN
jgi:hypothetical protein